MEDRGPILRLVLIGTIGVALVLLALWMARRMARSAAQDGQRTEQVER